MIYAVSNATSPVTDVPKNQYEMPITPIEVQKENGIGGNLFGGTQEQGRWNDADIMENQRKSAGTFNQINAAFAADPSILKSRRKTRQMLQQFDPNISRKDSNYVRKLYAQGAHSVGSEYGKNYAKRHSYGRAWAGGNAYLAQNTYGTGRGYAKDQNGNLVEVSDGINRVNGFVTTGYKGVTDSNGKNIGGTYNVALGYNQTAPSQTMEELSRKHILRQINTEDFNNQFIPFINNDMSALRSEVQSLLPSGTDIKDITKGSDEYNQIWNYLVQQLNEGSNTVRQLNAHKYLSMLDAAEARIYGKPSNENVIDFYQRNYWKKNDKAANEKLNRIAYLDGNNMWKLRDDQNTGSDDIDRNKIVFKNGGDIEKMSNGSNMQTNQKQKIQETIAKGSIRKLALDKAKGDKNKARKLKKQIYEILKKGSEEEKKKIASELQEIAQSSDPQELAQHAKESDQEDTQMAKLGTKLEYLNYLNEDPCKEIKYFKKGGNCSVCKAKAQAAALYNCKGGLVKKAKKPIKAENGAKVYDMDSIKFLRKNLPVYGNDTASYTGRDFLESMAGESLRKTQRRPAYDYDQNGRMIGSRPMSFDEAQYEKADQFGAYDDFKLRDEIRKPLYYKDYNGIYQPTTYGPEEAEEAVEDFDRYYQVPSHLRDRVKNY